MSDPWDWADSQLKAAILSDPAGVLRDRGMDVPADIPLAVVHEFVRVVSLLWVEGRVLPLADFRIDPSDDGLLFGRGVWESTRTVNGEPWLWSMHLDRMKKTAALLGIDPAAGRLPTTQQVRDYVRSLTTQDVLVRLNLTAGPPGKPGLLWMSASARPLVAPLRLGTCRTPVQKGHPYLTLKTFQYATRLRISQQANQAGFDSALLVDEQSHILEAAHANIFLRLPDGWVTPTADGGLLPGTIRQYLLERSPVKIREQFVPVSALADVTEAFLTNSNVGIIPVTQIDGYQLTVGEETRRLTGWLEPPAGPGTQYRFVTRPPAAR